MPKRSALVLALALVLPPVVSPRLAAADSCPVLTDATRLCQETIGKASSIYAKLHVKSVQLCLAKIHAGDLAGDPATVCRGNPPTDASTADKLTKAAAKVLTLLQAKCTDGDVAALDLCAPTVAGLATCLVADHAARVDAVIEAQFGTLVPSNDLGEQACQKTVAKEGGKFVTKYLKTVQRCFNTRNKLECAEDDRVSKCLAPGLDGPKAEAKAAKKIQKAEENLHAKVALGCTDTQLAALDACGSTTGTAGDCLVCSHKQVATLLMGAEYDGIRVADTGTGIQPVVDLAEEGDTILIEPGTYTETVEVKDSGVSLIGLKDCSTGARAVIESPDPGVTPNGISACGSYGPGCSNIADDLLFQGIEVHNFEDNAIFVVGAEGVAFRDVVTIGDGTNTGMEYGPFPILSNNVLIEDSEVVGVRDAGIYVGQSTNIVVRRNEVHGNVAGIEIENSANSKVYENHAYDNTGGILVFKLPGLAVQLSNCNEVYDNLVVNNNRPNFGSGTVGLVPRGTGILLLSGDSVHVHDNIVQGNHTFGLVVADQAILNALNNPDPFPVPSPDAAVEDNMYVDNVLNGNATSPDGAFVAFAGDALFAPADPGTANNCQSGNAIGIDALNSFAGLPACTIAAPAGCPLPATPPVPTTTTTPSTTTTTTTFPASWAAIYAGAIAPAGCNSCHGGAAGLTISDCNTALTNMIDVASTQYPVMDRIEPFDSLNSWLVRKLDGSHVAFNGSCTGGGGSCGVQMPFGGPYLPAHVITSLAAWIDAGAVNDCAP